MVVAEFGNLPSCAGLARPAPTPAPSPTPTEAPPGLWELSNETPLHRAALDGDAEAVEDLLGQGADIIAVASTYNPETGFSLDSATPLHLAALNNSGPEVAALLLDRGADLNAQDKNHWTPLYWAEGYNPVAAVAGLLLDRGTDVNAKDQADLTPLYWGARNNPSPAVAALLLDWGADVNAKGVSYSTPLHGAAYNPVPAVAELLLDRGAGGQTPLHFALMRQSRPAGVAWHPDPEVVALLPDRGADAHAKDRVGYTPCHLATSNADSVDPHILDCLCVAPNLPAPTEAPSRLWELSNETPLHRAALDGDAEAVEDLLDQGADISALAAAYDPETGRQLLEATPLHVAALIIPTRRWPCFCWTGARTSTPERIMVIRRVMWPGTM